MPLLSYRASTYLRWFSAASLGSGCFLMPGTIFLPQAGPVGACCGIALGDALRHFCLYRLGGVDVYAGELALSALTAAGCVLLICRSRRAVMALPRFFAATALASLVLLLVGVLITGGERQMLRPAFSALSNPYPVSPVMRLATLTPWLFAGFAVCTFAVDRERRADRSPVPAAAAALREAVSEIYDSRPVYFSNEEQDRPGFETYIRQFPPPRRRNLISACADSSGRSRM